MIYSILHCISFLSPCRNKDLITVNTKKETLTTAEYLPATQNSHGYFFSPDGSKAISARYWFDAISVGVMEFKKGSNVPQSYEEVFLENDVVLMGPLPTMHIG